MTVVDVVKLYGEEFCDLLGHPFTTNTITVAALTGVAATLLMGETVHRAACINRHKLDPEHVDQWEDTRLMIVDEVSFASPQLFEKLDQNLRTLKACQSQKYGGLNMVFAGDL